MSIEKNVFSGRLKHFRKEAGFYQSELAEKAQMTTAAICNYEKGIRVPQFESLIKLSKALDISIDTLVGR